MGQGVKLKCLRDPTLSFVTTIGRTAGGIDGAKPRELRLSDRVDYAGMDTDCKYPPAERGISRLV